VALWFPEENPQVISMGASAQTPVRK
jgi:osmotically-inducible protein OsmY